MTRDELARALDDTKQAVDDLWERIISIPPDPTVEDNTVLPGWHAEGYYNGAHSYLKEAVEKFSGIDQNIYYSSSFLDIYALLGKAETCLALGYLQLAREP